MTNFNVKLIGSTANPQTLSTAGALGCFEEKSSAELLAELSTLDETVRLAKEHVVLKNSFGRGHGSVGDQNCFIFSIENLPRLATFQLCLPEYLAHLQQSLRRAKASRGYYLSPVIAKSRLADRTNAVFFQCFQFYEKAVELGVPSEDARFLLPLCTRTNIQTAGNARELCHLWQMSQGEGVPSVVKEIVDEMILQARLMAPYLFKDFGFNFETLAFCPAAQLFASNNETIGLLVKQNNKRNGVIPLGWISPFSNSQIAKTLTKVIKTRDEAELANLKHIHFEFLAPMSLACLHQAIRQRTWNQSVEPIYTAVERALSSKGMGMVVPPSIRKFNLLAEYQELHRQMLCLYRNLLEDGIPACEAIGVIPHSLRIYDLIHINGWNALHSIGKRTCLEAQWEIRGIAWTMAKYIKAMLPTLGKWVEPQCITYGKCPEIKDCGYYKLHATAHPSARPFEEKYGIIENETTRAFHQGRRMFCIYQDKLIIAEPDLPHSHAVWFENQGWITKDKDELMEKIVRGIIDNNGNVYFYIGYDFQINERIESIFFRHLGELVEKLKLKPDAKISGGLIKQEPGQKWPPRKEYGKIQDNM